MSLNLALIMGAWGAECQPPPPTQLHQRLCVHRVVPSPTIKDTAKTHRQRWLSEPRPRITAHNPKVYCRRTGFMLGNVIKLFIP